MSSLPSRARAFSRRTDGGRVWTYEGKTHHIQRARVRNERKQGTAARPLLLPATWQQQPSPHDNAQTARQFPSATKKVRIPFE
jgi:hypothetical protein